MKLAAIYNVFDGHELLKKSIQQIRAHVDTVYVVWQDVSNFGDYDREVKDVVYQLLEEGLIDRALYFQPSVGKNAARLETLKRTWGIETAREDGHTHFLHLDVDEFYFPDEFARAKQEIEKRGVSASACQIKVYYKSPTLAFSRLDKTYVPFIHKIEAGTKAGANEYPVYADPTRKINYEGSFHCFPDSQILMHHFSWVRKDISKKINNSTAKPNLIRHGRKLIEEYEAAVAGSHIRCLYDDVLIEQPNYFDL